MTLYVVDTNSWRVFGNYYPEAFPSFWDELERLAAASSLVSCREVANELELQNVAPHIDDWVDSHRTLFRRMLNSSPTGSCKSPLPFSGAPA